MSSWALIFVDRAAKTQLFGTRDCLSKTALYLGSEGQIEDSQAEWVGAFWAGEQHVCVQTLALTRKLNVPSIL